MFLFIMACYMNKLKITPRKKEIIKVVPVNSFSILL